MLLRTTLLLAVMATVCSCKLENPTKPNKEPEGKLIKMTLLCQPDAPYRSEATAEGSKDLIGVQIYTNSSNPRSAYARGLFSSISDIPEIEMFENRQYSIDVSIVANGQNLVYQQLSDWSYYRPFLIGPKNPCPTSNEFTYSTTTAHSYLSQGAGDIKENGESVSYRRPLWERYAGYSGAFTARDSSSIRIVARRVYAALQLRVEGLASGRIEVALLDSPIITLTPANNSRDTTVYVSLYGTTPGSEKWAAEGYNEVVNCVITHISPADVSSALTPDGGRKITLTRNHIVPIVIRPDRNGQLAISLEDGPMIKDDQIEI